MYLVFVLYALFASVFTVSKTGLQYAQPVFLVGIRMFIAGILMLSFQYFVRGRKIGFKKRDWVRILLLAVFNIYLTNILEFWGLQHLTSFKTCFIYSLSPFVAALLSYLMLSEKMSPKKWLGLAIGFLGFIPILMNESTSEVNLSHFFFLSWAELAVMGAAVCSVFGWIILRQLVSEGGYSPLMANGWSMFIGGAIALFHSFFREGWDPIPVTEFAPFLECAILLIIISNFLAYNLYGYLLKRFSATFVSFAGFTTPWFTALFGWFFLGEVVTLPFYISASIVFCGLFIFYQEELKQGYIAPQEASAELG